MKKQFTRCLTGIFIAAFGMVGVSEAHAGKNESLTNRQKAMVPISAFTASGNMDQLKTALNDGLDAVLTISEIKEILVHLYAYAGFPLKQASDARAQEAAGGEIIYTANTQLTDEQIEKLPFDLYRQGFEYYGKTHAHPNSTFRYTMSSLLDLMNFDAASHMDLINQPFLMMAGNKADSLYMTQRAFEKAVNAKDTELFLIEGATHIETYWKPHYVN
jgi:fermentation-respiration switch protein FrsA (DUF1100 family)